jgi:hypothetical protein
LFGQKKQPHKERDRGSICLLKIICLVLFKLKVVSHSLFLFREIV